MSAADPGGRLIYVADTHLTRDDPEVESFVAFLREVGPTAGTLYILGDLFNVWFGEPKFRMPHQGIVLAALEEAARRGVTLKFVEGNRDFSVRRNHLGRPFAAVSESSLVETYGGRRIHATHGDAINLDDRQYRLWKSVSRSFAVYGLFRLLPGAWGVAAGEALERKLSGTNLRNKSRFPLGHCERYAGKVFAGGCQALVLGHFHEEMEIRLPGGVVYVLPAWRGHHRYLVFEGTAEGRFEDFRR